MLVISQGAKKAPNSTQAPNTVTAPMSAARNGLAVGPASQSPWLPLVAASPGESFTSVCKVQVSCGGPNVHYSADAVTDPMPPSHV